MWPWPFTNDLEIQYVLDVVKVHAHARFHQAKCSTASSSWVIISTNFFALSRNGKKTENPVLWPRTWNSLGFEPLSSHMFMQNSIKLSAAVHELSWAQRKKPHTKTILYIATVDSNNRFRHGINDTNVSNCPSVLDATAAKASSMKGAGSL